MKWVSPSRARNRGRASRSDLTKLKLPLICLRLSAPPSNFTLETTRALFSLAELDSDHPPPPPPPPAPLRRLSAANDSSGKKYRGGGRNIVAGLLKEGAVREIGK